MPTRAPDAQTYVDKTVQQDESADDEQPVLSCDESLEYLHHTQRSNLEDTAVFELLEKAMNLIQSNKTAAEISRVKATINSQIL